MKSKRLLWGQWIERHRIAVVIGLIILVIGVTLIIVGFVEGTGFNSYTIITTSKTIGSTASPTTTTTTAYQPGKTLWDWLQLLIIPAVLAVGGFVINLTISRGEQEATRQRAQSERGAAEKRAKTEHEIALDNQREEALQAFIDKMSELMLRENFRESKYEGEAPIIARARTLTVLLRLDGRRKGDVIQFLYDANLVSSINLYGIDLSEAILPYARLNGAFLDGANFRKAYLYRADLSNANLFGTDLSKANLSGANLSGTIIVDADLYKANLNGAIGTTPEQLALAKSLEGATMPDGSVHA